MVDCLLYFKSFVNKCVFYGRNVLLVWVEVGVLIFLVVEKKKKIIINKYLMLLFFNKIY